MRRSAWISQALPKTESRIDCVGPMLESRLCRQLLRREVNPGRLGGVKGQTPLPAAQSRQKGGAAEGVGLGGRKFRSSQTWLLLIPLHREQATGPSAKSENNSCVGLFSEKQLNLILQSKIQPDSNQDIITPLASFVNECPICQLAFI